MMPGCQGIMIPTEKNGWWSTTWSKKGQNSSRDIVKKAVFLTDMIPDPDI